MSRPGQLRLAPHSDCFKKAFLFATTDGGITWKGLGQPAYWKRSRITAVPGTNALVSTSVIGFDRGSAVSYDNGLSWTTINNTILMAVCRFYNSSTGYAGSFFVTGLRTARVSINPRSRFRRRRP